MSEGCEVNSYSRFFCLTARTHFSALNTDPSGNLLLPASTPIPLSRVVALTPIGSRIANRFDGAVDFGYSFMKAQTTTQLNLSGDLRYTAPRRVVQFQIDSNVASRDQTTSTRRLQADLALRETLSRGYFAFAIGQFAFNQELNLIQRYLGGGGIGRYLVRNNHTVVSAYGGGAYSSEHYTAPSGATTAKVWSE